jgi:cyclophilin family peptidyl-prolyl cis-trans isomerase
MIPTLRVWLVALAGAALAAGCGGGNGNGTGITNMSANPAAYGRTAVWTVNGLHLDRGISFRIDEGSCDNVTEVPGGTATQRQFTCRPSSLGVLVGEVNDESGSRMAKLRVNIPVPVVRLSLAQGSIDLELDPVKAPVSVNNFLDYVNSNFYDNTIFHRVIDNFVIQGGGYRPGTTDPSPKAPTFPAIALESNNGLLNLRGTVAMARTADPDSATSQFYINVADNPDLDYKSDAEPGYAVFGKVIAGMDVVDAIKVVQTRAAPALGLTDLPVTNVIVTTARQIQ